MTYLEQLQRFRELLNTMTLQGAIDKIAEETGNDEWWSSGIFEGGQDAWAELFEKTYKGVNWSDEDVMAEKYTPTWKIYIDTLIRNIKEFGAIKKGDGKYTYVEADTDIFVEGGDAYMALKAGRQVTLDKDGRIIDVWSPLTKKTYDIQGNETGTRDTPYPIIPSFALPNMSDAELEKTRLSVVTEWNAENDSLSATRSAMKAKAKRASNIAREQTRRKQKAQGYQKRAPKAKVPKYKQLK